MTLNSSQPHAIKPAPTEGPNSFISRFTLLSYCAPFMFVNLGEVNRGKDEISAKDGGECRRQINGDGGTRR